MLVCCFAVVYLSGSVNQNEIFPHHFYFTKCGQGNLELQGLHAYLAHVTDLHRDGSQWANPYAVMSRFIDCI